MGKAYSIKLSLYLAQMVLANHVRGYNEFPVSMFLKPGDENLLVGLPTAAGNKHFTPLALWRGDGGEALNDRKLLGCGLNLQYTVEARIAHHLHSRNTYLGQKLFADVVLHIETGKALQHMTILAAIPAEEDLTWTEDTAYAIDGNPTMA